jgi:multiple sugar transport system substrate-binding protein
LKQRIRGRRSLGAVLPLFFLAAACGGQAMPTATPVALAPATAPTSAAAGPATTGPAPAPVTGAVNFQVFGDPAELSVFQAIVQGYKTANPGVKVTINHIPAQTEYMTRLSSALTAGNAPDVFLLNYRRYGQYADKGVLEPLGAWMEKSATLQPADYYPESLGAFTYKGTLQCIPQNVSSLSVYYNKALFQQYNIPLPAAGWKWPDFLKAAQGLTKDTDGDGALDLHGLGVEPQLIRVAPFVWQHGGDIVDNAENPTKLTLDDPRAREAVRFFVNLSLTYRVTPTEAEAKAEDLESRFIHGKLGMFLGSRADTPTFRTIKDFAWDVAPLPGDQTEATILHSDAYCMAAASKNKAAAWDFIQYAQGETGQEVAAKLGRTVPSRKSVAASPAFLDPAQPPANSRMYLDVVPSIRRVPITASWPAVEKVVNEELERAFYGTAPVDIAMQAAMEKANAELGKGRQ